MAKTFTTAVYQKVREVFQAQAFEGTWQKFLTDTCKAKALVGLSGFSSAESPGLDKLRTKLKEAATEAGNVGKAILKASQNAQPGGSLNARAAALKVLRHSYLVQKSGAQDVWVYAPPKAHAGWMFDEIVGSPEVIEPKLSADEELFSREEMEWMATGLKIALKICEDAKAKLAAKSDETAAVVKRWFLDGDDDDAHLNDAFAKLNDGFKKIAVTCGSGSLVFTDYADWRAQRDKYFGAAIRGGEGGGFPVIYLEGAFTRLTGNTGKQWLCVETIIHEFSHHDVKTRDHRYDSSGLKPDKASFPYAKTIENADSWGYFALDLAGYLSDGDRAKTWK